MSLKIQAPNDWKPLYGNNENATWVRFYLSDKVTGAVFAGRVFDTVEDCVRWADDNMIHCWREVYSIAECYFVPES